MICGESLRGRNLRIKSLSLVMSQYRTHQILLILLILIHVVNLYCVVCYEMSYLQ